MRFAFDCVFHYVSDMDRAISFYRDLPGLAFKSRDVVARFDIDGVLFELVPAPRGHSVGGRGNARLCLCVDDIQEAARYLAARDIPVGEIQDKGSGWLACFRDPDDNEICLWQYRESAVQSR